MKTLLFDFDGTIADTLEIALKFSEEKAKEFSIHHIGREEFRSLSMREALKKMGLPLYRLPQFVRALKHHMAERLQSVVLFDGMAEVLRNLKDESFQIIILSSNSEENIRGVIQSYGIESSIDKVVSDSSIFGKHVVIGKLLRNLNLDPGKVIYVGDEVRDAEACLKVGIPIITVTWGWDTRARLEQEYVQHCVDSPRELFEKVLALTY